MQPILRMILENTRRLTLYRISHQRHCRWRICLVLCACRVNLLSCFEFRCFDFQSFLFRCSSSNKTISFKFNCQICQQLSCRHAHERCVAWGNGHSDPPSEKALFCCFAMKQLKTCFVLRVCKISTYAANEPRSAVVFWYFQNEQGPSPFLGLTLLNRLSVSCFVDLVQWRRAKNPLSSINQNILFELKIGSTGFYIPQTTPRVTAEMF